MKSDPFLCVGGHSAFHMNLVQCQDLAVKLSDQTSDRRKCHALFLAKAELVQKEEECEACFASVHLLHACPHTKAYSSIRKWTDKERSCSLELLKRVGCNCYWTNRYDIDYETEVVLVWNYSYTENEKFIVPPEQQHVVVHKTIFSVMGNRYLFWDIALVKFLVDVLYLFVQFLIDVCNPFFTMSFYTKHIHWFTADPRSSHELKEVVHRRTV